MKKIPMIIMLCVFAVMSIAAVNAQYFQSGPDIETTLQRYEPQPAEPGTYSDVYLRVTNHVGVAENLQVEFVEKYPFTLAPGESAIKKIGDLDSLQRNYAVIDYRVRIAPDAINKDYNFTIYHSTGQGDSKVKKEFPIRVRGSDASVTLESYSFTPEDIRPGQTADLQMVFVNTGNGPVKDIDVGLGFEDIKVSTMGSGTTKRIPRLEPGSKETVSYKVIVDGSAEIKVYDIPVNLKYRDYLNSEYNATTHLGMIVKAEPEIDVRLDQSAITSASESGEVSVQVVNSGIVDQRYVTLTLLPSAEYESLSYSDINYIGNLDSDDFEIADYRIKPKVAQPTLKFRVDFKDPYNKEYSKDFQVPLRIITEEDLGTKKSSTWPVILVLLILAGGAYWLNKKRKHKKSLEHRPAAQKETKKRR